MTNVNLTQNFARVIRHLQDEGLGATQIAKMIGYTSTSQLNNSLEDKSMLSTKAILSLIERLNVNPIYLFMGKGDMFLNESEETEFTKLYNTYNNLHSKYNDALDTIKKLKERNSILEKMTSNLLMDTAALMKSFNEISNDTSVQEDEQKTQN